MKNERFFVPSSNTQQKDFNELKQFEFYSDFSSACFDFLNFERIQIGKINQFFYGF